MYGLFGSIKGLFGFIRFYSVLFGVQSVLYRVIPFDSGFIRFHFGFIRVMYSLFGIIGFIRCVFRIDSILFGLEGREVGLERELALLGRLGALPEAVHLPWGRGSTLSPEERQRPNFISQSAFIN